MDKKRLKKAAAVFAFLCIEFLVIDAASAHRVNVFAWAEGDTIYLESKFAGGRPVKSGKVVVLDPEDVELLTGLTDDEGEFSFKVPRQTDLKIVLVAGQGHQAEWIVRAAELEALPSGTAPDSGSKKTGGSANKNPAEGLSVDNKTIRQSDISPGELEAVIESVMDRKLKPITRMLADMQQEGPSAKDIFAGIGYIFGLAGIAAYVRSRKRKDR